MARTVTRSQPEHPEHLDFCAGGEFCTLDDCLCRCHVPAPGPLDVERLTVAMRTYYAKGDGHIVPLGLRDKFGLPDIWPELARGIAAEYEKSR